MMCFTYCKPSHLIQVLLSRLRVEWKKIYIICSLNIVFIIILKYKYNKAQLNQARKLSPQKYTENSRKFSQKIEETNDSVINLLSSGIESSRTGGRRIVRLCFKTIHFPLKIGITSTGKEPRLMIGLTTTYLQYENLE